jgi:hypothetical protein
VCHYLAWPFRHDGLTKAIQLPSHRLAHIVLR